MMKRLLFLLALATLVHADERTVIPAQPGPNRLDPDPEFLAHAKPDLGDLRLVDASGHEQPYLVIAPPTADPKWLAGQVLPVAATKKSSGFELDLGAIHAFDRLRVEGVATPFLKRARLEGSGDRTHWTLLADDATLFDLPDEKLRNVEISFEPGDYRYLRLTWDDRASAVVTNVASASARLHVAGTTPDAAHVALPFHKIASEPRKSRYRITLPGPNLPMVAVEAVVANGEVFRPASVYAQRLEQGQIVPVLLGASTLKRAERFGGVASDLAVPVSKPGEVELELVVDDGNNPPLALTSIEARLAPLPWIWFEATASSVTARYGNPRLEPPTYDIEASRTSIARTTPPRAKWGSSARPSATEAAETETIASFRGAAVNRADFRYNRTVAAAPAGVARLFLDADVLARSRQIADVRLVDAQNRQVPYIVEDLAAPLTVALKMPARTVEGTTSRYTFELPYDTLPPATRLVITTTAKVFERSVTLRAAGDDRRGREPYALANETWRNNQPDLAAPPLEFELASNDSRHVELVVNEGDNAPLPVATATLQLPSVALRFYNSGSALTLLYGNARATTPQYDLALLAPRVLGEAARDLQLAEPASPAVAEGSSLDVKIFWIALAIVTLLLLAVLARLIGSRASATNP